MLVFTAVPGVVVTTNATPGTENDCMFIKPGSTRSVMLRALSLIGRSAGATTIASIVAQLKKWTTTSSSGGTGLTPGPVEVGYQASKSTAGYGAATVTSGTGGPSLLYALGCAQGGPGGWMARDDYSGYTLEGGDNKSIDLFNSAGVASVPFLLAAEAVE